MFQYATGRRLAHRLGVGLRLDISHFRREWLRQYSLGAFHINAELGVPNEPTQPVYRDNFGEFNAAVLTAPDGSYLEGNWQSAWYFEDIRPLLLGEFVPKNLPEGRDAELARQIQECEAVCITVRRGDYATVPRVKAYYGVLPADYYRRAAAELARRVVRPVFFIFSDDPTWARRELRLPYPTVLVDHNYTHRHVFLERYTLYRVAHRYLKTFRSERSWMDLHLCRLCRHFVLANSTFSWWGAWLGASSGSQVFVPKDWFNPRRRADPARSSEDAAAVRLLLPPTWEPI
jgi:hypothetical protein